MVGSMTSHETATQEGSCWRHTTSGNGLSMYNIPLQQGVDQASSPTVAALVAIDFLDSLKSMVQFAIPSSVFRSIVGAHCQRVILGLDLDNAATEERFGSLQNSVGGKNHAALGRIRYVWNSC
jgi:hypothetical protein